MLYSLFVEKLKIKLASWFLRQPPLPLFGQKPTFLIFFFLTLPLVDDELNVIDEESEVEEDDDSHEGVTDEEVLVDGVLAVRTGTSTVSYAAVHKELLWCHHDDEDNVVDEEFEVEEEDVFHEYYCSSLPKILSVS